MTTYICASERLAKALQEAGASYELIVHAQLGFFDLWKSPIKFPKMALLDELRRAGLHPLALRVIQGEFDCDPEETREHFKREFDRLRATKWNTHT